MSALWFDATCRVKESDVMPSHSTAPEGWRTPRCFACVNVHRNSVRSWTAARSPPHSQSVFIRVHPWLNQLVPFPFRIGTLAAWCVALRSAHRMAGALRRVHSLREPSCRLRIVPFGVRGHVRALVRRDMSREGKRCHAIALQDASPFSTLVVANVSSLHLCPRKTEEMRRFSRLRPRGAASVGCYNCNQRRSRSFSD
jgi:hypothetical protein